MAGVSDVQPPAAPEPSFYDEVGGMATFERIVDRFYDGVETDEVLRPMYPEADLADGSARRRFMLFLVQYWGGPSTYSEERGHPRLRMRHAPFVVDETAQEHWLTHFRAALDQVGLTEEQDARLWGYVTYAAQFMRNA
jgi:hemoglobin